MSITKPQAIDVAALCRRAFEEYGTQALWNLRSFENPTPEDALVVARRLRVDGDLPARALAEEIERVCGASH